MSYLKSIKYSVLIFVLISCSSLIAGEMLKPGEYIPSLFQRRYSEAFVVQRLSENSYIAMVSAHNATFYVGKKGVLLIDTTLLHTAPALVSAIRSVTSLPITTMIYSHYHMDHVGGANVIAEESVKTGNKINVVATRAVAEQVKRHGNKLPAATTIIDNDGGEFDFEDTKVKLHVPYMGGGHSADNSIIYIPDEKLLHYVDLIHPELLFPFFGLGLYDVLAAEESLEEVLAMNWDYINGGHGNVGSMKDVRELQTYLNELKTAVSNALAAVLFGNHISQGPDVGVYTWIKSHDEAIAAHVKNALSDKYGHLRNYNAVIDSHALAMKEYLTLY